MKAGTAVAELSDPVAEAVAALERGHRLFTGASVSAGGAGGGEHDFHADRIAGSIGGGGVPESAHAHSGAVVQGLHRLAGVDSELAAVVGEARAGRDQASHATRAILDAAKADPMPAADTALGQREALRRMVIRLRSQHGHVAHSRAQAKVLAARLRRLRYLREHAQGGGLDGASVGGDERAKTLAAIRKALDIKGIHDPVARARWERGMDTVAGRESTWRDKINLSDSNAAAGHPSQGVFQFTPGTFAAYYEPGTAHSLHDRVAEACAFINYAHGHYGVHMDGSNLAARIQQADPHRSPRGY
jgi:SLT domain-containing protein